MIALNLGLKAMMIVMKKVSTAPLSLRGVVLTAKKPILIYL